MPVLVSVSLLQDPNITMHVHLMTSNDLVTHLSLRPLSSLDSPGLASSLLSSRSSSLDVLTTRDSNGISKLLTIQLILHYKISCIRVSLEVGTFAGGPNYPKCS